MSTLVTPISMETVPIFLRDRSNKSIFITRKVLLGSDDFNDVNKSDDILTSDVKFTEVKSGSRTKKPQNRLVHIGLNLVIAISIIVGASLIGPNIYQKLFPVEVKPVSAQTEGSPIGGDFSLGVNIPEERSSSGNQNEDGQDSGDKNQTNYKVAKKYIPPVDENLPEGDWLVIPRIGVRSELQTTENYQDALDTGLWMAPDFGTPGDDSMPMIIAGHRFGWDWWWKDDYWKYNSFYLLPDLEPGDTFEIISEQRKWVYEVYSGEEGEQISDYDADVILYTCKYLTGPARHFRYARLVNMDADTQR